MSVTVAEMFIRVVIVAVFAAGQLSSLPHEPRIIGGVNTTIEEHPYQVKSFALLTENYVIDTFSKIAYHQSAKSFQWSCSVPTSTKF